MMPILTKAFSINMLNISTYKGYDGADILKLTFTEESILVIIRDFCRSIGIKTNSKQSMTANYRFTLPGFAVICIVNDFIHCPPYKPNAQRRLQVLFR